MEVDGDETDVTWATATATNNSQVSVNKLLLSVCRLYFVYVRPSVCLVCPSVFSAEMDVFCLIFDPESLQKKLCLDCLFAMK